jgi:hypothetical protein
VDPDDHEVAVRTHRGLPACPHRDFMIIVEKPS